MNNTTGVVLDTNIWLSALIFGGKPRQIVDLFAHGNIEVIISEEILTEMRRNVRTKFPDFVPDLGQMEVLLEQSSELVQLGSITIDVSRDPFDNRILETAVIGKCEFVISGDKDLLVLENYNGIRIVNPGQFLLQWK